MSTALLLVRAASTFEAPKNVCGSQYRSPVLAKTSSHGEDAKIAPLVASKVKCRHADIKCTYGPEKNP